MPPGPADAKRSRAKERARSLVMGVCAGLALAEIAVRLRFGSPIPEHRPLELIQADELRGWGMVPNTDHYTYQHPVHVNALGMRGGDVPLDRQDELRVLCLGDSLVYGQGVANDQTIPAHLERLLRQRMPGRKVRALNAGVRAYSTPQELGFLRELEPFVKPSVVVLFWFNNDFEELDLKRTYEHLKASGPITFDVAARMEGWHFASWELRELARKSALLMELHDAWAIWTAKPWPASFVDAGIARLDDYLAQFVELQRASGSRFLMVSVPDASALAGPSPAEELTRRAFGVATKHAIETLDPLEAVRALYAWRGDLPVIPYDGHYDGEANEAIAQKVAERLAAGAGGN